MENKEKQNSMYLHYFCEKCKGDELHEIRQQGVVKMRIKKGTPPVELMEFEYACVKCCDKQVDLIEYNNAHPNSPLDYEPIYWKVGYMVIPKWNEFVRFGGYD